MIALAIDVSTARGAVALVGDDQPLGEETFDRSKPEMNLFDAARRLLAANGLQVNDLGLFAVGLGPGSFTGIRAGIAAAKGLALPHQLPMQGVSSYDVIAATALPDLPSDCEQICVLGDARRGAIYFTIYNRDAQRTQEDRIGTLESLADEIHNPIWFVSSEIEKFQRDLVGLFGGFATVCNYSVFPSATVLGRQAARAFRNAGNRGDNNLEPIYLRKPEYRSL